MVTFVCKDCGKTFEGTKRRKTCKFCKSRNIEIVEGDLVINGEEIQNAPLELKEESEKEENLEEFFREEGDKKGIKEFFRELEEKGKAGEEINWEETVPSEISSLIGLVFDYVYSPKEIREFKPSETQIKRYSRIAMDFLQERGKNITPQQSFLLATLLLMSPAILYYGGKVFKGLEKYLKLKSFKKKLVPQLESSEKSGTVLESSSIGSKGESENENQSFDIWKSPEER